MLKLLEKSIRLSLPMALYSIILTISQNIATGFGGDGTIFASKSYS